MSESLESLSPREVEVVRSLRNFATEAGISPHAYPSARLLLFKASFARREEKAAAARRLDLVLQLATLALTLGGVSLAVLARWPLPQGMSIWILAGLAFPAALWSPLRSPEI
jgi:hypothetical protein